VRGVTRAAAYVPTNPAERAPSTAWDEDGFTLAATALERLAGPEGTLAIPDRLLLVGETSTAIAANLALFLGAPVPSEAFGLGRAGLDAAVHAALGRHGSDLLVAIDRAAPAGNGSAAPLPPDAAVAAWVTEDSHPETPSDLPDVPGTADRVTPPFFELAGRLRLTRSADWVGDWEPTLLATRRAASAPPGPGDAPAFGPVSQGAYVPRPRYVENLPSRWRFAAQKCAACGALTFPARGRCRKCAETEGLTPTYLPRDGGLVVATTVIGKGGQPTEFDDQVETSGPYEVVLVELAPGVRVTLQVASLTMGTVPIGSRVATRLRRIYPMDGEWRYGRKALAVR
jgi:uncharacterized OB-fold protein